jgi:DnaJ-class molecular chaperone
MPLMKGGKNGDLYIIIEIIVPKNLTDEQKELIERLATAGL